jgi:RimJ/RimL family protein N-acetyltransferase
MSSSIVLGISSDSPLSEKSKMTDPDFCIVTPRLCLSYYQPIDYHCDFLVALYNSPEVLLGNGGVATALPDREAARRELESKMEWQARTGYGRYVISIPPEIDPNIAPDTRPFSQRLKDHQLIGNVSMKIRHHPESPPVPDVGFALIRAHWGKGYATEATSALIDYFEKERGQKEVLGYCNPNNEDSKKMFQRLGFENRGEHVVQGIRPGGGLNALVWAKKGMNTDMAVYGF